MRTPRKLIPIPMRLAEDIGRIAGSGRRNAFIVELLERELRRRDQLESLEEVAGCWKDEDHPELAGGSEAWVREMRKEAEKRSERLLDQREAQ